MTVYLVVYDKGSFQLSGKLFNSIKQYIDDNYIEEHLTDVKSRSMEDLEVSDRILRESEPLAVRTYSQITKPQKKTGRLD